MVKSHPIDYLTIKGFQSIQNLENFPLHNLNVLIGANGAGKSNFVAYFRMLSELVEQRLQIWVTKRGGADRLLTFGVKETQQFISHLQFGDNGYQFTLEPTDTGAFVFVNEMYYDIGSSVQDGEPNGYIHGALDIGENGFTHQIGSGYQEARVIEQDNPIAHSIVENIRNWRVYHFHDTSDTAGVKRWGTLSDKAYLRPDASNLAAFLYWLRRDDSAVYEQIRSTVQLAIPFFDDFILETRTNGSDDEDVRLTWRQIHSDYPMSPTQLSDGSLRFICLTTALLQPNPPSTLIIDEPELGLHPYAITLLGALMRSAALSMQLIVSTQSVPLLNEFSLDDIIVVEREDGVSQFRRLQETEYHTWLDDYSVGELWEKNVLGGRP